MMILKTVQIKNLILSILSPGHSPDVCVHWIENKFELQNKTL